MTKLNSESPVVRQTTAVYRGRPIVIELLPGYMRLRFKGKRESHILDYPVAIECAMKVEAREKGVKI